MVGEKSDETAEKCDGNGERESERQPESEQRASVVCTSHPSVVCKERERKREKGKEEGKEEEEEEGRREGYGAAQTEE